MELSVAAIQRIAKKSGVERIGKDTAEALGKVAEDFIGTLAKKGSEIAAHSGRKTLQIGDIELAAGTKIEAPKQPPTPVPASTPKTS